MTQQKIKYRDVMDLGFKETYCNDKVFKDELGYDYKIVELKLTKKISIDWNIETRLCELLRVNNNRECDVKGRYPIKDLEELKRIIEFHKD